MVIENFECVFIEHNLPEGNNSYHNDIPIFIWPNFQHQGNETEHIMECLSDKGVDTPFIIVSFFVEDWNRDLSPWEAPAVFGDDKFLGLGDKTLQWMDESLLPYIRSKYNDYLTNLFMMGYSLAGLFSLWAMYERDYFSGCVAASPSVWFPNWDNYVMEKMREIDQLAQSATNKKKVYLSIGNKEEKTRNAIMKTVGDRIRWQFKILDENKNFDATYEVNPGGHFADSGERLSKGIAWVLDQVLNHL